VFQYDVGMRFAENMTYTAVSSSKHQGNTALIVYFTYECQRVHEFITIKNSKSRVTTLNLFRTSKTVIFMVNILSVELWLRHIVIFQCLRTWILSFMVSINMPTLLEITYSRDRRNVMKWNLLFISESRCLFWKAVSEHGYVANRLDGCRQEH
jgi:hypothetical protein